MLKQFLICIFILFISTACTSDEHYAPVTDISTLEPIPKSGMHSVVRGETLYSIAWRYGFDYRDLAAKNHISPPYDIRIGQNIIVSSHQIPIVANGAPFIDLSESPTETLYRKPHNIKRYKWVWPVQGNIYKSFSGASKGIDIAAAWGSPVRATQGGKIVYSGNGLRGYGNLIIIKHDSLYLSAYAHNRINHVKEGDWVKKGQKIAEVGRFRSEKALLHFEIRRAGKPINPLSLLPS